MGKFTHWEQFFYAFINEEKTTNILKKFKIKFFLNKNLRHKLMLGHIDNFYKFFF